MDYSKKREGDMVDKELLWSNRSYFNFIKFENHA